MASFSSAASQAAHAISAALVSILQSDTPPPQEPLRRILTVARDEQLGLAKRSDQGDLHWISVDIIQSLLDRLDRLASLECGHMAGADDVGAGNDHSVLD